MTVRPIIFSDPMVRALLDGRKTMTRRILKLDPEPVEYDGMWMWKQGIRWGAVTDPTYPTKYVPGDLLWVRENFSIDEGGVIPDGGGGQMDYIEPSVLYAADGYIGRLKPSIFMPRIHSRLTLEVEAVKVERLHDINEEDAKAEGIPTHVVEQTFQKCYRDPAESEAKRIEYFSKLWISINGASAWDANPWVVAITFSVHKCNVDAMMKDRAA